MVIRECATLSRVRLLCAASIHLTKRVASILVKLPQGLAGGDCRLFFERNHLPKPRTRIFCFGRSTPEPAFLILWFALIIDLVCGIHLPRRGFTSEFSSSGYLPATANEHYQSELKVFHLIGVALQFVWPLFADLSGMGNPNRRFFSIQKNSAGHGGWRHPNFSVTVRKWFVKMGVPGTPSKIVFLVFLFVSFRFGFFRAFALASRHAK